MTGIRYYSIRMHLYYSIPFYIDYWGEKSALGENV
jgi:hypothetical protein